MSKEEMKGEREYFMTKEERAEFNRRVRIKAALAIKGTDLDPFKGIDSLPYEAIYGGIRPETENAQEKEVDIGMVYVELMRLSEISYESWKFSRDEAIKDRDFWKARCIELEGLLKEQA